MRYFRIILVVILTFLTLYLLYRLSVNEMFTRIDYILLIILIIGGIIHSVLYDLFRKRKDVDKNA
jgi:hypothetical protein